ncbi:hypothetical protein [Actinoplanes sp. NPDC049118]|uniref:hypothetical protein n=1 Tax=Actinoplanes sp. NPDC049118 TaxID=3155769 RepID=UPI0033FE436A
MGVSPPGRRPGAVVLAAVALGVLFGPAACGDGENRPNPPSARASADATTGRPAPTRTEPTGGPTTGRTRTAGPEEPTGEATAQATPEPTGEPTRTTAPARTTTATTRPATPARTQTTTRKPATAGTTEPTTATPSPTPTSAAPVTPTTVSGTWGPGPLGWFLLILLLAGLIGGLVVWRSRRRQRWEAGAEALAADTRALVGVRLPSILATTTAADRALSWPPVRADLADLAARWGLHAGNAPGEEQRRRSGLVSVQLRDLIAGVDAENEALATGREWQLLRPRVDDIVRTLSAALGGEPQPGYGPEYG